MPLGQRSGNELPTHVGPAEFSDFGVAYVAVRCPSDLAPLINAVLRTVVEP
jgi:hypothetical protein